MRIIPIPNRVGVRSGGRARTSLRAALALSAATTVALGACGDGGADAASGDGGEERLAVVASFHPLAEAAARVGGERVAVEDLTPAGSEPHDLELTPDQVDDLEDADLVLVLGRGFQPGPEEVAARRDGATLELLDALGVAAGEVAGDHDHDHDHDHETHHEDDHETHHEDDHETHHEDDHDQASEGDGPLDPHVWLDPTRMAAIVEEVAGALTDLDPEGAETYATNAATFGDELAELDAEFEATLAGCAGEVVVVSHEAFGWLAERYGLVQEGIAGLAPQSEPDPDRLSQLVDLVEREGVTTVFTETLVSPRVAETLAREAGVRTAVLNPLEGLTEDQRAEGATYLDVMRENLAALAGALECASPQ